VLANWLQRSDDHVHGARTEPRAAELVLDFGLEPRKEQEVVRPRISIVVAPNARIVRVVIQADEDGVATIDNVGRKSVGARVEVDGGSPLRSLKISYVNSSPGGDAATVDGGLVR
jgi:hypothetical protein